jgi:hypothetical protein
MQPLPMLQRRPSCVFAVVFSIAVTASPLAARAQSEGAAPSTPADKLFKEAGAAMDRGEYATACPKIEEVVRMRPDGLGAKVTLAQCYEGAGRLASAWELWRQIEPLAEVEPPAEKAKHPDRQKEAQQRAQELAPKLATLAIVVPAAVRALPGLEITRDGKVVDPAQWGVPVPVDKGRHVIGVTATGRERAEWVKEVEADGVAKAVLVDPPGVAAPAAPPVVPAEPKRSVVPAVVLGTVGAAGITSGIVFSALLAWKNSQAATAHAMIVARAGTCISYVASYDYVWCPQLVAAGNAANKFYDAAVGAFVVGGAAAAGTALYLLWPSFRTKTAEPPAARDVRLTPILGPNGGGLVLSGSF